MLKVGTRLPIFTGHRVFSLQAEHTAESKCTRIFPVLSLRDWSRGIRLSGQATTVSSPISPSTFTSKSAMSRGLSSASYFSKDCERPALGPSSFIPLACQDSIACPFTNPASAYCSCGFFPDSSKRFWISGSSWASALVAGVTSTSVMNWVLFVSSHVSLTNPFCPHTFCDSICNHPWISVMISSSLLTCSACRFLPYTNVEIAPRLLRNTYCPGKYNSSLISPYSMRLSRLFTLLYHFFISFFLPIGILLGYNLITSSFGWK